MLLWTGEEVIGQAEDTGNPRDTNPKPYDINTHFEIDHQAAISATQQGSKGQQLENVENEFETGSK